MTSGQKKATKTLPQVSVRASAPRGEAGDTFRDKAKGSFEPFGTDWQANTPAGVSDNGLYLRLPGQWDDGTWDDATSGAGVYYNVHRWYQPATGSYTRPDPAGLIRSRFDPYGYATKNPLRSIDPYGLKTCVVISGDALFNLGGAFAAFGDHAALLLGGPCRSNSSCPPRPGPVLYDPGGGYAEQFPGSGSADILSDAIPGWDFPGFVDYHCDSGSDLLEIYCFDTTCCEENQIEEQMTRVQPGLCAIGVSNAISGVGPFSGLRGTPTPALLRRALNKILRNYTGPGTAVGWTYTCSQSSEK